MPLHNKHHKMHRHPSEYAPSLVGKRAEQRKNFRDNTRYDRKVAKLTQIRPNGFGN